MLPIPQRPCPAGTTIRSSNPSAAPPPQSNHPQPCSQRLSHGNSLGLNSPFRRGPSPPPPTPFKKSEIPQLPWGSPSSQLGALVKVSSAAANERSHTGNSDLSLSIFNKIHITIIYLLLLLHLSWLLGYSCHTPSLFSFHLSDITVGSLHGLNAPGVRGHHL